MDYIKSKAKEQAINNVAIIEDQNVYDWAIDYYIKSNEELGITKINNKVNPTPKEETNNSNNMQLSLEV